MTIKKVETTIKSIRKDSLIDATDAEKAIAAAEKTKLGKKDVVTNIEGKAIGKLVEDSIVVGAPPNIPGIMWNPPPLGTPQHPHMASEAAKKFNDFFIRNKLPYGENQQTIRGRIESKLTEEMILTPLARKPNVNNLHEVNLPSPPHIADAPNRTAFYDSVKDQFYLRINGGRGSGGKDSWFGPIKLDKAVVGDS